MRNLFICFLLATLAWLVQAGPSPVVEPATYLGILVVCPVLAARLCRNLQFPPAVGAVVAGAILNQSGLLNAEILVSVISFKEVGLVWLGLYLGTRISQSATWSGPFGTSSISIFVASTLLVTIASGLLPLTLLERLQLGLMGAICAPIFTMLTPNHHRDEIGVAGLSTCLALAMLCVTYESASLTDKTFLSQAAIYLVLLFLSAEIAFRSVRGAVSGPGRYLVLILAMGALWQMADILSVHPGLVGITFGVALGLRARRWQDTLQPLAEASSFVGPFVLGFVSAELDWSRLLYAPAKAWIVGALIILPAVTGKAIAGLVARRLTRFSHQDWLSAYPFGLAAIEALPMVLPDRLFLGVVTQPVEGYLPAILIGAVVLPMSVCFVDRAGNYIVSRRNESAPLRGREST